MPEIRKEAPNAKKRSADRSGFTLIELALVALFILVITVLSTPRFRRSYTDLELRSSVADLVKMTRYAQERAIVERVPLKLNFDFNEGEYYLSIKDQEGEASAYKRMATRFGKTIHLPKSITLEGDMETITFYPDGHSDTTSLVLENDDGGSMELEFKGVMGKVEVNEEISE
ncbi:MAG: hypothetical protein HQ593_06075 [Candidatus Omnitrophica bacterium]|nr:hypothetical protein [Candidatus Omnitrophota bacterium]